MHSCAMDRSSLMMLPTGLEANHRGLSPNSDERVTPTSAPAPPRINIFKRGRCAKLQISLQGIAHATTSAIAFLRRRTGSRSPDAASSRICAPNLSLSYPRLLLGQQRRPRFVENGLQKPQGVAVQLIHTLTRTRQVARRPIPP